MSIPRYMIGRYCTYRHGRSWRSRKPQPFVGRTLEALRKGIAVVFMQDEPVANQRPR